MTKRILLNQFILVAVVFALTQVVLTVVLHTLGWNYFNSENWLRWDSGHYLQIAKGGYELFPCAGKMGYPLDSLDMCGNTGWYPGYPFLIKTLGLLFGNEIIIAGVLSKLFYILSLFLVLKVSQRHELTAGNLLFLSVAAFSFSFIYSNAIFPISSLLLCALAGLYFFTKKNYWLTGLFCFLASVFYPTGFILSIVFASVIFFDGSKSMKQRIFTLLIPSISGVLGVLLVLLVFQLAVNDWTAFMQVQAKYGHSMQNPVGGIYSSFKQNLSLSNLSIASFIHYQSFIIFIGYCLSVFYFFYKRMYQHELFLWTFIYVSGYYIFPWMVGGDLSRYRAESLLLPFVFLLNNVKERWLAVILICLIGVGIPMSYLFFNSTLV